MIIKVTNNDGVTVETVNIDEKTKTGAFVTVCTIVGFAAIVKGVIKTAYKCIKTIKGA